ncbi:uncharacterized protein LOC132192615 isoform X2 [Neocloeon triangulifer]|uniref:uncharacterized protein LOC132192615 isoform X2 n=1 Tax=Neocloeon triangulifer TaxID=2078957 RepID=UPI00286F5889|nr:uncharacterized protein LOC132192615 isoform X2 [Neocloeon triangulifer]
MILARHFLFLLLLLLLCDEFLCNRHKKRINARKRGLKRLSKSRNMVIKCCGTSSCTIPSGRKNVSMRSTIRHLSTTMIDEEDESSTKDTMIENPTHENASPNEAEGGETTAAIVSEGELPGDTSPDAEASTQKDESVDSTTMEPPPVSENTQNSASPELPIGTNPIMINPTSTSTVVSTLPAVCQPSCNKDSSLFNSDGTVQDSSYHGFWVTTCGKLFVFGKSLVNWEENVNKCCSLGMKPIAFENKDELECFNKYIQSGSWKYNKYYWLFSQKSTMDKTFRWCSNNQEISSELWLDKSKANGTESCLQMEISTVANQALLLTKECTMLKAFACQGSTTPKPNIKCATPICPRANCSKDPTYFKAMLDDATMYLSEPAKHGIWTNVGSRTYMVSNESDLRTYQEAAAACCSIGLKQISLQQSYLYESVKKALTGANVTSGKFWTSGTDMECEGNFAFCTTNKLLGAEARWSSTQMNVSGKSPNCVSLDANVALSKDSCDSKFRYICEGRLPTPSLGAESRQDCATLYGLAMPDVRRTLEVGPLNQKENCFIWCFAEESGVFENGKLVEEAIFSILFELSQGNETKLKDMYYAVNFCLNLTKNFEPCERAGSLLKCGREKASEMINLLRDRVEKSANVETPFLFPPMLSQSACPVDYSCEINKTRQMLFLAASNFSTFEIPSEIKGQITPACMNTFLALQTSYDVPLKTALQTCCSFGLRLATVDNRRKYTCMIDNKITDKLGVDQRFAVGASRMGNLQKPVWCYSNAPFDFNLGANNMSNDTSQFVVYFSFANANLSAGVNSIKNFICETS